MNGCVWRVCRRPWLLAGLCLISARAADGREFDLHLSTTPSQAAIFINGDRLNKETTATIAIRDGDKVRVEYPGYKPVTFRASSKRPTRTIKLRPMPRFLMLVETKTTGRKWAGTKDLDLVLQLNGSKQLQRSLDHEGRDRRVGGRDKYVLEFAELPVEDVKSIRLAVLAGDDKWRCDYVAVRIIKPNEPTSQSSMVSQKMVFRVNGWFSCDSAEGYQRYDAKLPRLRFRKAKPVDALLAD